MNHNPKTIEEIFDDAVNALRSGTSVEEILARHPEHKGELEEMLGVVLMLEDVKLAEVPSEQLRGAFSPHDALPRTDARTFGLLEALFRPTFRMPAAILAVLLIAVLAVNRVSAPAPTIQYQSPGAEVAQLSQNTAGDSIAMKQQPPVGGSTDNAGDYPVEGFDTAGAAMMAAPEATPSIAAKSAAPVSAVDTSAFDPAVIAATEAVLIFPQFESFVADEIALTAYEQELTR